MYILFRYAFLLALGFVSIVAFVSASTVTGQMLASTSGYPMQNPGDLPFYVLAAVGLLGFVSMARFVVSGVPQIVRDWTDRKRRSNYAMLAVVCLISAVFVIA